jgi:hypothetical protein
MMPDLAKTQITWRPCPEWSGYGPTLLRLGELLQMLKVNYFYSMFIVHFFSIEKHSLVSVVLLLHFMKCFGIVSFIIRKVPHLAWCTVVFILSVLWVGWHYASMEVPLLMIPLLFPQIMINEWMWSVLWNEDWHQTTYVLWENPVSGLPVTSETLRLVLRPIQPPH